MNETLELTTAQTFSEQFWYNALPVGTFYDPRYGRVDITKALVEGIAANFWSAPAYPPPVKLGHGDGAPSPGTVKEAEARPDGLYIRVEVDDGTAGDIRSAKYRFMSAEYVPDYMDKRTGLRIGPVLQGVALTNQPAHPGVAPIALSDGKWVQTGGPVPAPVGTGDDGEGDGSMADGKVDLSEILSMQLSEAKAALEAARAEAEKAKSEAEEAKKLSDAARTEAEVLRKAARESEVKAFCDGWAGKGIPPAVIDRVRPVLLAESAAVKLSDGQDADLRKLFGEIFEAVPKVEMAAKGDPNATKNPAADAVALADDIAARANARPAKK